MVRKNTKGLFWKGVLGNLLSGIGILLILISFIVFFFKFIIGIILLVLGIFLEIKGHQNRLEYKMDTGHILYGEN